jgi:glutaredoxin
MKGFVLGIVAVTIVLIGGAVMLTKPHAPKYSNLDEFAQCLTDKKLTMYGAVWCPHCQNQKKLFGNAFKKVTYVECPDNPQLCTEKGVKGYPTWITGDGKKLEGEQTLEQLAQETSCELKK